MLGAWEAEDRSAKRTRCGECSGCLGEDCGKCANCADKPKFGGAGALFPRREMNGLPRARRGKSAARARAR